MHRYQKIYTRIIKSSKDIALHCCKLLGLEGDIIEKHSISSEAGVDESKAGNLYEWMFKSENSKIYKT